MVDYPSAGTGNHIREIAKRVRLHALYRCIDQYCTQWHTNYPRWIPVHLRDMVALEYKHISVIVPVTPILVLTCVRASSYVSFTRRTYFSGYIYRYYIYILTTIRAVCKCVLTHMSFSSLASAIPLQSSRKFV